MSSGNPYFLAFRLIRTWLNDLSLLVVFGTSVTFYFFSVVLGKHVDAWVVSALALSVWCIYTADHLRDGYMHKEHSVMSRHRRHYTFRRLFTVLLVLALASLFYIVYNKVELKWVLFGASMIALVLLYFLLNLLVRRGTGRNLPFKELGIAIVVTLSLAYSPMMDRTIVLSEWVVLLVFFLINWVNLLQFSLFDHQHDRSSGFASIGAYMQPGALARTIRWLLLIQLPLFAFLFWNWQVEVQGIMILALMWSQQCIIIWKAAYFSKQERYRFWGDLVYLLPMLYFI